MIKLRRTNSDDPGFRELVVLLDALLQELDGEEHVFYAQYNKLDNIQHVIVAYANERPVGCGAIKAFEKDTAEVKRMFVHGEFRNQGIASQILSALEYWAGELQFKRCILETGKKQKEAIALYQKTGYTVISNYGQYAGVANSVCMVKTLQLSAPLS